MTEENQEGTVTPATQRADDAGHDAGHKEIDDEISLPSNRKKLLVWLGLALAAWLLVIGLGYVVVTALKPLSETNAVPTPAAVTAPAADRDAARTVTVPAVRGVDATGCRPDEIAVEGNRLVLSNGCAHPVFHGQ